MLVGITAATSAGPVVALYVRSAVKAAGCSPDWPYAARSLSVLMNPTCQNGSSLITQDPLTLG